MFNSIKTFAKNTAAKVKSAFATAEAVAVAYREGHFNADQLIVKASYTITAADKAEFRKNNIILSDSL